MSIKSYLQQIFFLYINTLGAYTDEYRIGFRYPVNSAEDAKSEMVKLFQEAWENENGYFFTDSRPAFKKYAEDFLRNDKKQL